MFPSYTNLYNELTIRFYLFYCKRKESNIETLGIQSQFAVLLFQTRTKVVHKNIIQSYRKVKKIFFLITKPISKLNN